MFVAQFSGGEYDGWWNYPVRVSEDRERLEEWCKKAVQEIKDRNELLPDLKAFYIKFVAKNPPPTLIFEPMPEWEKLRMPKSKITDAMRAEKSQIVNRNQKAQTTYQSLLDTWQTEVWVPVLKEFLDSHRMPMPPAETSGLTSWSRYWLQPTAAYSFEYKDEVPSWDIEEIEVV